MSRFYRVFSLGSTEPDLPALLQHLHRFGFEVEARFRADDEGWIRAELTLNQEADSLYLDRYLVGEDGFRAELNAWAAWLETLETNANAADLMARMIGTQQLFMMASDQPRHEEFCRQVCLYLAGLTDGIYQLDGAGLFARDGSLLVPE